ncbi:hypothetical protein AURDEDRAFT_171087 [Auricularia subglabra TFB-10046 SS5]|nr:hypothetical protein AURDEDRAFT_171087 [Auricularia subglabra TFB-10046 SS5]
MRRSVDASRLYETRHRLTSCARHSLSFRTNVPLLKEDNFAHFEHAFLGAKMLSCFIEPGKEQAPLVDPSRPETADQLEEWEKKKTPRSEFLEYYKAKNAAKFGNALEERFRTKRPGQSFQAMSEEPSIQMKDGNTLCDLYTRVMDKSRERKRLRPENYSLKNFDERSTRVWMRALPDEYGTRGSTIHVSNGERPLDMKTILAAARKETRLEFNRTREDVRNGEKKESVKANAAAPECKPSATVANATTSR